MAVQPEINWTRHENHSKENYRTLYLSNILLCPNTPKIGLSEHVQNDHLLLWSECLYLPQNSYGGNLIPKGMVLGGESFALMNGIVDRAP